jgi:hypothetical protein
MRVAVVPMEQGTAQFFLEHLDCARQRRLRDIAMLGRPGEIPGSGKGQKISDLVHFHCRAPHSPSD